MRHATIDEALIDALITATYQNCARPQGQFLCHLLIEAAPCRTHEPDGRGLIGSIGARSIDGIFKRLGHHDHPGAAAIWPVVYRTMHVLCEIARIPHLQLPQTLGVCTTRYTVLADCFENIGEQRDNIEAHGSQKSTGQSLSSRLPAISTVCTCARTNGTKVSMCLPF